MKIDVKQDGEIFVVELEGRMDTNTSPEFQKEMETYYSREGFKMILDGECDSIPESCFLFAGTIDDVFEKAKNNQNQ